MKPTYKRYDWIDLVLSFILGAGIMFAFLVYVVNN
jgi:hypothetical protein